MYCVIQELQRKRADKSGADRELYPTQDYHNGLKKYGYCFCGGRFERTIHTAYKISIHVSKREYGKVKKEQYVIGTFGYYDLVIFAYENDAELKFNEDAVNYVADCLNIDVFTVYGMIWEKLDPIVDKACSAFRQTQEYLTHSKHLDIILNYEIAKDDFAKKYGCPKDTYDYIYNVFGKLMNQELLNKIIKDYNERVKRSSQSRHSAGRSKQSRSNYNPKKSKREMLWEIQELLWKKSTNQSDIDSSEIWVFDSILEDTKMTQPDGQVVFIPHRFKGDKGALKKLYRKLCKIYHPDNNVYSSGNIDELDEMMKFINELKVCWGV